MGVFFEHKFNVVDKAQSLMDGKTTTTSETTLFSFPNVFPFGEKTLASGFLGYKFVPVEESTPSPAMEKISNMLISFGLLKESPQPEPQQVPFYLNNLKRFFYGKKLEPPSPRNVEAAVSHLLERLEVIATEGDDMDHSDKFTGNVQLEVVSPMEHLVASLSKLRRGVAKWLIKIITVYRMKPARVPTTSSLTGEEFQNMTPCPSLFKEATPPHEYEQSIFSELITYIKSYRYRSKPPAHSAANTISVIGHELQNVTPCTSFFKEASLPQEHQEESPVSKYASVWTPLKIVLNGLSISFPEPQLAFVQVLDLQATVSSLLSFLRSLSSWIHGYVPTITDLHIVSIACALIVCVLSGLCLLVYALAWHHMGPWTPRRRKLRSCPDHGKRFIAHCRMIYGRDGLQLYFSCMLGGLFLLFLVMLTNEVVFPLFWLSALVMFLVDKDLCVEIGCFVNDVVNEVYEQGNSRQPMTQNAAPRQARGVPQNAAPRQRNLSRRMVINPAFIIASASPPAAAAA